MQYFLQLPADVDCLVKVGQKVDYETPLFKKKARTINIIPISDKLNISPKKIFNFLKKFVGEEVKKNEIIAVKKGILGSKVLRSPYQGTIREINHEEGKIVIETAKDIQTIPAYFKGEITSVKKNQITVEVSQVNSYDLKQASGNFGGGTFIIKSSDSLENLGSDKIDKNIVICETLTSYQQTKLEALGTKGIVSLKKLTEVTNTPTAVIKNIEDLKKIMSKLANYCVIDSQSGKIYFYEQK